ncbi:LAMI_0G00870g1_1 [Lachancea mirantina]|uniref:LAMI_0G00870g1_1 n=1 Tax=Lachancea mirantina TaxID=1230905 RepID=A0A1G4K7A3_9SACH|nr:LAMI_0G00870g1_1 [Lachancea mirantina]
MSFNSPFFDFFDTVSGEVDNFNRLLGYSPYASRQPGQKALTKADRKSNQNQAVTPYGGGLGGGWSRWFNDDSLVPFGGSVGLVPPVDILEHAKDYELHITLPGVKDKKDVNLEYHQEHNEVVISGEIPASTTEKTQDTVRVQERSSGKFRRVISLPDKPGIDIDNIKANYKGGILTLKVPKLEPEDNDKNAVRKIEISSQDSWGDSKL